LTTGSTPGMRVNPGNAAVACDLAGADHSDPDAAGRSRMVVEWKFSGLEPKEE
jgi:hypothetical protein